MKIHKFLTLLILSLGLFLTSANAQSKKTKTVKKSKSSATKKIMNSTPKPPIDAAKTEYKILLEGSQSKVETPFIFVARDAETYAEMRGLVEGLPASSTIDFSQAVVVAAFAGTRNTGGWSVAVKPSADKIIVDVNAPGKGDMTAQVITYPFQVALVPVAENQPLNIETAAIWTNELKNYRVTKANFQYSGGIAGRSKKFNAAGTIGVLSYGNHLTYFFNLAGKGNESQRKLTEMVSGVAKNGSVEFTRLDAGNFSEMPHPALKVTGTATADKLALVFEPLPTNVADGFAARGKLEAVRIK